MQPADQLQTPDGPWSAGKDGNSRDRPVLATGTMPSTGCGWHSLKGHRIASGAIGGLEMVSPKQLTLLAAAGVAASLVLAQPARALTAIAQPYLISIDQDSCRCCAAYRTPAVAWLSRWMAWLPSRVAGLLQALAEVRLQQTLAEIRLLAAWTRPGGDTATIPGVDMSRARIAQGLGSREVHRATQGNRKARSAS